MMKRKFLLKMLGSIKKIRIRKRNKTRITKEFVYKNIDNKSNQKLTKGKKRYKLKFKKKLSINKVCFNHIITDIEIRLKYLNLIDNQGKKYGSYIPIDSNPLIVKDQNNKEHQAIRIGFNQVSIDLYSFINKNHINPGNIISVEFKKFNKSVDEKCVIYIKPVVENFSKIFYLMI